MADQVTIFAKFVAADGKADQLRKLLLGLVQPTLAEPGCVHYTIHEDMAKPGAFYFYEVFQDEAAVKVHAESVYFQAAFAAAQNLLAEPLSVSTTKFIAGK
jgi:quinol monooxygenase YgiN